MSFDSLLIAFVLVASLALAALGWAAYLFCAFRLRHLRAEEAERRRRSWSDWHIPESDSASERSGEEARRPSITVEDDPVHVAPPARARVYRPETGPQPDGPDEPPPSWLLEDVLDEEMEPVRERRAGDDAPAWL